MARVRSGGRPGSVNLRVTPRAFVEFPVARLHSNNPLEDRELRRRIDARQFPTITGELRSMEATTTAGLYLVRGDVTFKGVTRLSAGEVTVSLNGGDTIRLNGSSVFDIRDFGMDPPGILMLKVAPDVKVTIDIVAEKER